MNKYMKVNKYDEILADDFQKAINWLLKKRAELTSMKSAPKKSSSWRDLRIKAIHAREREHPDGNARRKSYMSKNFGVESLVELDDERLEACYRHVMGWKRGQ
jgi:hypothetical protein